MAKYGIFAAMQQFSQTHGIETRLLSRNNGRSLTNYFQLLELLAAEDAQNRNPAALHKWLRDQISLVSNNGGDNRAIRLESDEDLVKIVTMHASKGLQYPLVYCPFAWDAQDTGPSDWQILHQGANRPNFWQRRNCRKANRSNTPTKKWRNACACFMSR